MRLLWPGSFHCYRHSLAVFLEVTVDLRALQRFTVHCLDVHMLYESVIYCRCTLMRSLPCSISRKLFHCLITSRNFETPLVLQLPITSQQKLKVLICQRVHRGHYHPGQWCCLYPSFRPLHSSWPGGVWWGTTSWTTRMPIQKDVTNNGEEGEGCYLCPELFGGERRVCGLVQGQDA